MKVYRLQRTQVLPIDLNEAWDYFSTPINLQSITPDDLKFEILTPLTKEDKMYEGQIINYFVSPFSGVKFRWTTEITHVEDQKYFVDEQRFGPYSFWHHKHFFESVENGVMMTDIIDYALPFGILGRMVHSLFIKKKVETIFKFRTEILSSKFGSV